MIKVKEFATEMEWDYDDDCYVASKPLYKKLNEFLEKNPNIKVIDIKYQVRFGSKFMEDNESQALLIYEEKESE